MPRYILICEATTHCCFATRNEVTTLLDIRTNPVSGYTDVQKTLAILEAADDELREMTGAHKHYAVSFLLAPMGKHTLHVEGRMDLQARDLKYPCPICKVTAKPCLHRRGLIWVEAGHRCTPECLRRQHQRVEQQMFGYRKEHTR